jgi:hypothetical protein
MNWKWNLQISSSSTRLKNMKVKYFFIGLLALTSAGFFAWAQSASPAKKQFMLIVRSKAMPPVSQELIATNISHWQECMGSLGRSRQLAGGYRPGNDGETISGSSKSVKMGSHTANGEVVSSFLIINADDMSKASEIAARCPVLELDGSVEIRPMQNTAH